jgi:hypothetical protein
VRSSLASCVSIWISPPASEFTGMPTDGGFSVVRVEILQRCLRKPKEHLAILRLLQRCSYDQHGLEDLERLLDSFASFP